VYAYKAIDDHRDLEDQPDAEDECGHERDVLRGAQLVIDDVAAEIDEELDGVRKQHEIAERHAGDEEEQDEWPEPERESPLVRVQRGVDVHVDLVQDDRHRERDAAEQRHAHEGGEVLGRAQGDEAAYPGRKHQDPDDVDREDERDHRRDHHRDRRHH